MFLNAVSFTSGEADTTAEHVIRLSKLTLIQLSTVLVFPAVVLLGYFIEVLSNVATEQRSLPDFSFNHDLFVTGLYGLLFHVIGTIVVLTLYGSVLHIFPEIAVFLYYLFIAAVAYVFPAVFIRFVVTRSVRDALDMREYAEILVSREYIVGTLISSAVYVSSGLLAGVSALTGVGVLFGPGILFAGKLAGLFCLGRGYRDAALRRQL